jgi:hypothetical protein
MFNGLDAVSAERRAVTRAVTDAPDIWCQQIGDFAAWSDRVGEIARVSVGELTSKAVPDILLGMEPLTG